MKTGKSCRTAVFLIKTAIVTSLIFWGGVAGARTTAAVASAGTGDDFLRIIYSGGLTGNIEPCG